MESDLLNYQQQAAKRQDLVAGLSYSIVSNYLNRVVGRRRIGDNICFQGGTAFNKAVWSAFEQVTGKKIMVPDHHEVTGAIGVASIAAEYMEKIRSERGRDIKSSFRGFQLVDLDYETSSLECSKCNSLCQISQLSLGGNVLASWGGLCDLWQECVKL